MIRVAIDAMGGDLGPRIAFQATEKIVAAFTDVEAHFYFDPQEFDFPVESPSSRIIPTFGALSRGGKLLAYWY